MIRVAFVTEGSRLRVVQRGLLGLGLQMMVYLYHDFAWQGKRFSAVGRRVLGLGLIMALRRRRFKSVWEGILVEGCFRKEVFVQG
jgi:hypothetical protein